MTRCFIFVLCVQGNAAQGKKKPLFRGKSYKDACQDLRMKSPAVSIPHCYEKSLLFQWSTHSARNSIFEFGRENMGCISANANRRRPPRLQGQWLAGFGLAWGNEANRKAWMPVVNHPETPRGPGYNCSSQKRRRGGVIRRHSRETFPPGNRGKWLRASRKSCRSEYGVCSPCIFILSIMFTRPEQDLALRPKDLLQVDKRRNTCLWWRGKLTLKTLASISAGQHLQILSVSHHRGNLDV